MSDEKKDFGDKAEESFDKAKDKAKKMAGEAKEGAREFREEAKKTAEEAKESAKEFKEEAKKTAEEFSDGLKSAGGENKKILAGILAIFVGWAGIHKFILGYQKEGIILLVVSIIGIATSCLIIGSFILMATGLIGLIEGIIYLTKTDEDFYNTYQVGRKPWF